MKKTDDLRKTDVLKLTTSLKDAREKLMDKKILFASGKEKDVTIFPKSRKEIARIQTILKEKEVLNER